MHVLRFAFYLIDFFCTALALAINSFIYLALRCQRHPERADPVEGGVWEWEMGDGHELIVLNTILGIFWQWPHD